MDAPLHAMLAGRAGLPHDLEPDLAGNALLIEDHLAHDEAQQLLALGRGGRRRVPYSWQVLAQNLQRAPIGLAQDERLRAAPSLVFLFDRFQARSFSSQARSSERATSRFSGSTASYWRRARSA